LEQLIAESTGKQGRGIVPIHAEPLGSTDLYGKDRLFIYLRRKGKYDGKINLLLKAGHPVLTQDILNNSAIGAEFYKWEVAISTACSIIGVNPFDQPNVQDSKSRTLEKISYYKTHQAFDEQSAVFEDQGISLFEVNR
jgi:transaldolase/glucose-6-phosphate isomerase